MLDRIFYQYMPLYFVTKYIFATTIKLNQYRQHPNILTTQLGYKGGNLNYAGSIRELCR
jgi:hypothetical protein